MATIRALLAQGNGKLGQSIHHFDLPAVTTCPGRSPACEAVCYANCGRFHADLVRDRLRWCLRQSRREDFADRMVDEIRRKGVLVVRIHVSGDFYNAPYTQKWLTVFHQCPATRFFLYTRSWRVPEIAVVLEQMAEQSNVRVWYSADPETGLPEPVPAGVRVAWMQSSEDDPQLGNLVFRVQRLRTHPIGRVGLPMVCPHETPGGRHRNVNCGNCGHCWS